MVGMEELQENYSAVFMLNWKYKLNFGIFETQNEIILHQPAVTRTQNGQSKSKSISYKKYTEKPSIYL